MAQSQGKSSSFRRSGKIDSVFCAAALAIFLILSVFHDARGAGAGQGTTKRNTDKNSEGLISLPSESGRSSKPKASGTKTTKADQVQAEDMLRGVFFDLLRPVKSSAPLLKTAASRTSQTEEVDDLLQTMKKLVLGKWSTGQDAKGAAVYPDFGQYFRYAVNTYNSYFYITSVSSSEMIRQFNDDNASSSGWIGVYSGYVVAPFTGIFRFVGCGDDGLVVRFNRQLVLDYGYYSLSLGKSISSPDDCVEGDASKNQAHRAISGKKGLYFDKPDLYFSKTFGSHGIASGLPISVTQGKVYPIEILYTDIEGGNFSVALFIEMLGSNERPLKANPEKLPLFRTSSELPEYVSGGNLPDFDSNSPIWRVVDSGGKPIPSHKPPVAAESKKNASAETAKTAADKTGSSASARENQPVKSQAASDSQPQPERDPSLRKTVTRTTSGNVTTETVTEYNGDTTIETVTTTEVNGDTTVQTTVMTETKNGVVVKKTSSTTTTMTEKQSTGSTPPASQASGTDKKTTPAETSTNSEKKDKSANPFGYTSPRMEDN